MDVPKDPVQNRVARERLLDECERSPALARQVRARCAEDILFWLNMFAWLFEPRSKVYLPFITYPFQDKAMLVIKDCIGREDLLAEKTRCMGATWMFLAAITHDWQFHPNGSHALISRQMDLVESKGDPDCLFWKVDCLLRTQPAFLVPRFVRREAHLENLDLGGTIDGYSTTGNVLRGGRKTSAFMDEFAAFERPDGYAALAATQSATNSRLFCSTPQGAAGAFYDMSVSGIRKLRLHWSDHPVYSVGLYTDKKGKLRSTWYDAEWKRMPIPQLFAQEFDIDYAGSGSTVFPADLITRLIAESAREPYLQGSVAWEEGDEPHWVEDDNGLLLLWTYLGPEGRPPEGRYVIGADISTGTGATPSVLSVADRQTGEKVAELAVATEAPDDFAVTAVGLAKWFHDAQLIWEINGPGARFGNRVIALGYRDVYWRTNERSLSKKQSDTPGWHNTRDNKLSAFQAYAAALASGKFVNRHKVALSECMEYVYLPTGGIGSRRAQPYKDGGRAFASLDPSGSRENHGDRPMADALACKLIDDQPRPSHTGGEDFDPNDPPVGSFAHRRLEWQRAKDRQGQKGWTGPRKPWRNPLRLPSR